MTDSRLDLGKPHNTRDEHQNAHRRRYKLVNGHGEIKRNDGIPRRKHRADAQQYINYATLAMALGDWGVEELQNEK